MDLVKELSKWTNNLAYLNERFDDLIDALNQKHELIEALSKRVIALEIRSEQLEEAAKRAASLEARIAHLEGKLDVVTQVALRPFGAGAVPLPPNAQPGSPDGLNGAGKA